VLAIFVIMMMSVNRDADIARIHHRAVDFLLQWSK